MARLVVIYKTPKDAAAFDKHYFGAHVPLAKKIPGLRKYEVSQGPVATPAGPSDFHLVATLYFDDMTAIQKAFASAEGQATAADVANVHNRTSVHAFVRQSRGLTDMQPAQLRTAGYRNRI